jgi:hypothetical protein
MNKLDDLERTYETRGEQPFSAELMKPSELQTIRYLQRLRVSANNDVQMLIAQVRTMLANAKLHTV